jgi:luciferase family oxidoreductase group 1
VKFGIFYELQLPRPWAADDEHQLFTDALDQIERADQLGYDHAWVVEHHFLEEYSHSSAPEVFLGAASQRTSRIRLGHGIVQLTTNHPARVAERISTLDLLSHGRVELGVGEGSTVTELHPFDRRFRDKREVWEDALRCLVPMFTSEAYEYHGTHFDFPLRNVLPKPLQQPHPPLWVACSQLDTIEMAGRRGLGALGFQFVSAEAAQAWVHAYYNAMTKRLDRLADYVTNPNIALVSQFMCAPTDEEAQRRADGATFFQFALRFYNTHGPVVPGTVSLWEEYQAWRSSEAGQKARSGGLIGSPGTIRRRLRKFAASGVDQIILLNQAGRNRHEHICEALELFATDVMPEFHAMEPDHQSWKQAVLTGALDLSEIDTAPYNPVTYQSPSWKASQATG